MILEPTLSHQHGVSDVRAESGRSIRIENQLKGQCQHELMAGTADFISEPSRMDCIDLWLNPCRECATVPEMVSNCGYRMSSVVAKQPHCSELIFERGDRSCKGSSSHSSYMFGGTTATSEEIVPDDQIRYKIYELNLKFVDGIAQMAQIELPERKVPQYSGNDVHSKFTIHPLWNTTAIRGVYGDPGPEDPFISQADGTDSSTKACIRASQGTNNRNLQVGVIPIEPKVDFLMPLSLRKFELESHGVGFRLSENPARDSPESPLFRGAGPASRATKITAAALPTASSGPELCIRDLSDSNRIEILNEIRLAIARKIRGVMAPDIFRRHKTVQDCPSIIVTDWDEDNAALSEGKVFETYLSPTSAQPSSFDGAAEDILESAAPFTRRLSVDALPLVYLDAIYATDEGVEAWNPLHLLYISDKIREMLAKENSLGSEEIELLDVVLTDILKREPKGNISLDFNEIVYSRFDKLLDGLIDLKTRRPPINDDLKDIISKAVLVHRAWQKRLGERLSAIQEDRVQAMIRPGGLLNEVVLRRSSKSSVPQWIPKKRSPGAGTEALFFEIGSWWLNIQCAYRDGIVNSISGGKKYGTSELTTVPLLKGVEMFDYRSKCIKYVLEGRLNEMQLHLQDKVGKRVRILRGYKLRSRDAPEAGIRYDGLYRLKRYGHRYADYTTGTYRMTLWYESQGQDDLGSYNSDVLTPSRMDDWDMFVRIEDEEFKKQSDPGKYAAWRAAKDKESGDRKEWHHQEQQKEDSDYRRD